VTEISLGNLESHLTKGGMQTMIAFLIVLALIGIGMLYQLYATARDAKQFPAPGQMIDVGGYKLHIYCTGPETDQPTVILDHVGAGNCAEWGLVQSEIAKSTRVCAYDRAGFGWNEPSPKPRDVEQAVLELHALLQNANIHEPLVLVGHSFGAHVSRFYATRYPDQVAGLVLIDPGHVYGYPNIPAEINAEWRREDGLIERWGFVLARLGLFRLHVPSAGDLPEPQAGAFLAHGASNKLWDTLNAVYHAFPQTAKQVLCENQTLGAMPVLVLSAELPVTPARQVWTDLNATLAKLSSNGVHRVIAGTHHMDFALKKEIAEVTTKAILEVVEAVRSGQALIP
jgi:pimeloyl-ACP methyl ester carboxylesterase